MSKRRLTKTQSRRIQQNQRASVKRARKLEESFDESMLGPEQHGRVIAHFGKQVDIETSELEIVRCHFRANLDTIVTGDQIIWRDSTNDDCGVVVSREERSSLLSRPDSFGKLKPVAANVDQIIVTIAPRPEPHTNLIDRYLVIAENNNIKPIVLVNKADLIDEKNQAFFSSLVSIYQPLSYEVLHTSAHTEEGLDSLKEKLKGKTSIFVGQSGVGKSSIIQSLVPEHDIEVGALSDAAEKGRHTTTHSRLFHFTAGGECIDSPGIREFGLWHLNEDDVIRGFKEIYDLAQNCKFRDCRHNKEPGCAVQAALENKELSHQRFESYSRIISSLDDVEIQQNKL